MALISVWVRLAGCELGGADLHQVWRGQVHVSRKHFQLGHGGREYTSSLPGTSWVRVKLVSYSTATDRLGWGAKLNGIC